MKTIVCFEHEKLQMSSRSKGFSQRHLDSLEKWISYQKKSGDASPYFSLIHKGIKFSSYVGMLQVGNLAIEVLPKISKHTDERPDEWKKLLLRMLKITKKINLQELNLQYQNLSNAPLSEIFLKSFIREVKYLIHKGLLKNYRREENNKTVLKGKINFSKNIKYNFIHKEKFYTNSVVYDYQTVLNKIILTAVRYIKCVSCVELDVNKIISDWGHVDVIDPTTIEWNRISYNRQNIIYKNAIDYARMILNFYNPNLSVGSYPVISFMFDMNKLFEEYVYQVLRHNSEFSKILFQKGKYFWENNVNKVLLRPDLLVYRNQDFFIFDTKWKLMETLRPSDEDLRQIFAYCHLFNCKAGYLVYPHYDGAPEDLPSVQYKNSDCSCGIKFFNLFADYGLAL